VVNDGKVGAGGPAPVDRPPPEASNESGATTPAAPAASCIECTGVVNPGPAPDPNPTIGGTLVSGLPRPDVNVGKSAAGTVTEGDGNPNLGRTPISRAGVTGSPGFPRPDVSDAARGAAARDAACTPSDSNSGSARRLRCTDVTRPAGRLAAGGRIDDGGAAAPSTAASLAGTGTLHPCSVPAAAPRC
jgi:hypothetical protein